MNSTSEPGASVAAAAASPTAGLLYGQLGGLLKAGMPLPDALRTLAAETRRSRYREALERAAKAIENGTPPEQAFAAEEKHLGGILGRITAASAAAGQLPAFLTELSVWTLNQYRTRRQILDALIYPYSVLLLTCVTGLVILAGLGRLGLAEETAWDFMPEETPGVSTATAMKIAFAGVSAILALCLSVPLLRFLARRARAFRVFYERLLVWLPVVGAVNRPLALSRFCGCVSILMKARRPYHEAIESAAPLVGLISYENAIRTVAAALKAGEAPEAAWARSRLFPASLRFILSSAQQRGDVPEAFAEMAELYQVEAEGRARVTAMLTPGIFLILVGAVFALVLWGILGPLSDALQIMTTYIRIGG